MRNSIWKKKIENLYNEDNNIAYKTLLELETMTTESNELEDEKGTSVRQCLEKLNLILMYKVEPTDVIENKVRNLDLSKYKESMQSLIKKDIDYILEHL